MHKSQDYTGEFNLLKNEKSLIAKAHLKHKGNIGNICRDLEISPFDLYTKLIEHGMEFKLSLPVSSATLSIR